MKAWRVDQDSLPSYTLTFTNTLFIKPS